MSNILFGTKSRTAFVVLHGPISVQFLISNNGVHQSAFTARASATVKYCRHRVYRSLINLERNYYLCDENQVPEKNT